MKYCSLWSQCKMKFASSQLRSKYFTASLFHMAKPYFTRRRRISLKKALAWASAFFWAHSTKTQLIHPKTLPWLPQGSRTHTDRQAQDNLFPSIHSKNWPLQAGFAQGGYQGIPSPFPYPFLYFRKSSLTAGRRGHPPVAFPQKSKPSRGSHNGATILHPNTKVLVNQGLFVFLGVKNNPSSPLHLFPDLLDLNLRLNYRLNVVDCLVFFWYNKIKKGGG